MFGLDQQTPQQANDEHTTGSTRDKKKFIMTKQEIRSGDLASIK